MKNKDKKILECFEYLCNEIDDLEERIDEMERADVVYREIIEDRFAEL